jgi:hypothetical protein
MRDPRMSLERARLGETQLKAGVGGPDQHGPDNAEGDDFNDHLTEREG